MNGQGISALRAASAVMVTRRPVFAVYHRMPVKAFKTWGLPLANPFWDKDFGARGLGVFSSLESMFDLCCCRKKSLLIG